ncbi:hypothetical protein T12_7334 [Trichinella patagoniensis]|uniref:Uncharacterized protein n=1 Tax=Trichinella patagoniensis TaxID=990121 RepID=A0A0V0ZQZ1_9BILA|nr:hypothetical protein T12_7334 [Trichinella patagoniensis]
MDRKVSSNLTVPILCKKKQNGNAQSVNCHPVTKSNIYANYLRHGILEVPEATDCSGITSVNKKSRPINPVAITISRSRRVERKTWTKEGKELEKEDLEEKVTGILEVPT